MGLGLCIVGCGQFSKTFVRAVRSFSGLAYGDELDLFFASRSRKKAQAYSRMFDGKGYFDSYEEAAADPRVQAMYICTPHQTHLEHVLMAARSSKHVLVEKPISRTLDEGQKMISAAREAGIQLMVAENFRFMPVVKKARELISEGVLGKLRFIQIQEEANFIPQGWRAQGEMSGGGVLIDGGIHSIDAMIDLGGPLEEVHACTLPKTLPGLDGEDGIVLMARLKGGATGLINHGWGISKKSWQRWVSISGTEGRIYFEPLKPNLTLETNQGKTRFRFPEDKTGIGNMVKEFRDCIAGDRPPSIPGEDGLLDLKVVLRAYESATKKRPIKID